MITALCMFNSAAYATQNFILFFSPISPQEQSDWGALIKDAEERGFILMASESKFHEVTKKVLKPIRYPHGHLESSNRIPILGHSDRHRDHRMHPRPSDRRPPEAYHASREQDGGNQNFTRSMPPSRRASDPRLHQSATRSFRSLSGHYERHTTSSNSHRK